MQFKIDNWRIKNQRYGWLVQHKVGKQWKESQYFVELSSATQHLYSQLIFEQTKDIKIDVVNQDETIRLLRELDVRLKDALEEIKEVFNGNYTYS